MAIVITDNTSNFSVNSAINVTERYPKNSVTMKRKQDSFIFTNWGDAQTKLFGFDVSQVTTPTHAEVLATGTIQLTGGAAGSVDSALVNSVELMSSAVAFNTSLIQTATDVASNITANTSVPNYTAASGGTDTVTITAVTDSGNTPNGFDVTSSSTTITTTDVDMSGGVSQADALETALDAIVFS